MATVIRKTDPSVGDWAAAHNALCQVNVGSHFHYDASEFTVTAATATDLTTSCALINNLIQVAAFHVADTVAHKAADATSLPAFGAAVDLSSAETAVNALKTWFNTHIASTTYHPNADATNTVSTANATDLATTEALANAMKTAVNAHMASAIAAASFRILPA